MHLQFFLHFLDLSRYMDSCVPENGMNILIYTLSLDLFSNSFWQYFLNPKVAKEPVPMQLELIAKDILVPLLAVFHQFVEKVAFFH